MTRILIHNKNQHQFELMLENGEKAIVQYRKEGNHLSLLHSEVPHALRGGRIGKELLEKTFEAIEKAGLTATAYCSYIRAVAKRSSKWNKIINI